MLKPNWHYSIQKRSFRCEVKNTLQNWIYCFLNPRSQLFNPIVNTSWPFLCQILTRRKIFYLWTFAIYEQPSNIRDSFWLDRQLCSLLYFYWPFNRDRRSRPHNLLSVTVLRAKRFLVHYWHDWQNPDNFAEENASEPPFPQHGGQCRRDAHRCKGYIF